MNDIPSGKPPIFVMRRLAEYSDEAILDELRRVAELIEGPITAIGFEQLARVGRNTVTRRFGSWLKALEAAGLGHRSAVALGAPGGVQTMISRMTNEEILSAMADLAKRLGTPQLTVSDVEAHLPFGRDTLKKRWGSSRQAFRAAGVGVSHLGRRYTDEECFDNLLSVWSHYGRPPQYLEMGKPPSEVGGKAYIKRFGTWNKALAAFVERVNGDETPPSTDPTQAPPPTASPSPSPTSPRNDGDRRDIPLGLRFKVFHRDRFKCVLCGDSPSANPACVLHVDHILPWSRGGKTVIDNLRALCGACNIGRGNRYLG
ncbi:MAG: homing endonuclease associated repeat-containing protein [Bacteroidales bacterium]